MSELEIRTKEYSWVDRLCDSRFVKPFLDSQRCLKKRAVSPIGQILIEFGGVAAIVFTIFVGLFLLSMLMFVMIDALAAIFPNYSGMMSTYATPIDATADLWENVIPYVGYMIDLMLHIFESVMYWILNLIGVANLPQVRPMPTY